MKTHWLYGEIKYKIEVDKDTDCNTCIHNHVCSHNKEARCVNFRHGDSQHDGCQGCEHKYPRYDRKPIPCFKCNEHNKEKPNADDQ